MVHATKNKTFNNCLMYFLLSGHSFFADDLESILSLVILDFKDFAEGTIGYLTDGLVRAIL